mmetsp:Transcript_24277/g.35017  ORF Transcript_24277/g.35017 Transcript_24277/m.35017 type:complete len:186 (+) Transcript_24277:99-656(+)
MALDPKQESVDGFELHFATNHIGHFLLTKKLMPLLDKTEGSRVVAHSSAANWRGKFQWDDIQGEKNDVPCDQYAMTKLVNSSPTSETNESRQPVSASPLARGPPRSCQNSAPRQRRARLSDHNVLLLECFYFWNLRDGIKARSIRVYCTRGRARSVLWTHRPRPLSQFDERELPWQTGAEQACIR